MQTSYMTGRYATQMDNVDNRPYWEYVAVMDSSTRPEHAMLNGMVYRYDDPFWKSFYPPNGCNCRCRVNALSDYRLKQKKLAGIFASATEDNFAEEGRPDKWIDLSEVTKKQRKKIGKYPGQILQVSGQLASSVNTYYYDDDSAVIGSNLAYTAIHQLGGQAGKNKKVAILTRPYLKLIDDNFNEILVLVQETIIEN